MEAMYRKYALAAFRFPGHQETPDVPEPHQLFAILVPYAEIKRSQAGQKGNRRHILKHRIFFMSAVQIVVRHPRAQMMNMVEANVSGEPIENLWQLIEGAPA